MLPVLFSRNYIILITDGKEGCDGDPCAVSLALQRQHVILKPFVIGLGLDVSIKDAFDCVGTYYDAAREESFKEVLNVVIAQALSNTTVQLNLNNEAGKPTGTNVPVTFFDATMGIGKEFIHGFDHWYLFHFQLSHDGMDGLSCREAIIIREQEDDK